MQIKAFTQSNAVVEPKVGGAFSWFSGSVHGEFVEMEQDKKLVGSWGTRLVGDRAERVAAGGLWAGRSVHGSWCHIWAR